MHRIDLRNLFAGTEYEVIVTRIHNGIASLPTRVTLETVLPSPSKITFKETSDSITVSWARSGVWVSEYKIEFEDPSGQIINRTVPPSRTTVNFSNLKQATLYKFRIYSKRGDIYSKAVQGEHLTSIPKPMNLFVKKVSTNEIFLRKRLELRPFSCYFKLTF